MLRGFRALAVPVMAAVAASLVVHADVATHSQSGEVQLQLGNEIFAEGRYQDALEAYTRALHMQDLSNPRAARSGIIQAALRVAEFDTARTESDALLKSSPHDPEAVALNGDALWASGLFDEAEARYHDALSVVPDMPRGHHGLARSLAARSQLDEALKE